MSRYIDADEALRMMRNSQQDNPCESPYKGIWHTAHESCISCVDAQPTADVVEVRHGKWLPTNIPTVFSGVIHECSLCKAKDGEHSSILGYYCWRCGAKMDGKRSDQNEGFISENIFPHKRAT